MGDAVAHMSLPAKIRAICFAPASNHNDVLFLAKSLPTITYTPLRWPTTLSFQGRNMPPSSPHATAVSWDLGVELTEGEELQFSTSGCFSTLQSSFRSDGPLSKPNNCRMKSHRLMTETLGRQLAIKFENRKLSADAHINIRRTDCGVVSSGT